MYFIETARSVRKKSDSSDHKELEKISDIRTKRLKAGKRAKPSPKSTGLVLRYSELVLRLRSEGLGWRSVAEYLRRYHRQRVSHQTLFKLFGAGQQPPD